MPPIVSGPYIGGGSPGGGGRFPFPSPSPGNFNSAAPITRQFPAPAPAQNAPGTYSGAPASTTVPAPQSNILQAGSVRPTGPTGGFDPAYLQNLATAIGGLFSRPGGNLTFNPLGNLADIPSPSLGFGTAAPSGLPSTMLQDALNGLAFLFNPQAPAPTASGSNVTGTPNGSTVGGNGRLQRLA